MIRPIDLLFTLRSVGYPTPTQNSLPTSWLGFSWTGLAPARLLINFPVSLLPIKPGFACRKPGGLGDYSAKAPTDPDLRNCRVGKRRVGP
jgi:hypothetical protein